MTAENQDNGLIQIVADLKDRVMHMESVTETHSEALSDMSGNSRGRHWAPCTPEEVIYYGHFTRIA